MYDIYYLWRRNFCYFILNQIKLYQYNLFFQLKNLQYFGAYFYECDFFWFLQIKKDKSLSHSYETIPNPFFFKYFQLKAKYIDFSILFSFKNKNKI